MLGTVINSISIIIGGFLGIKLKKGIKENYSNLIMDAISLSVIIIGIMGAIKSENIIVVIISLVIGAVIGEGLGIEKKLDHLGNKLQGKFGKKDSNFSKGFVTASLVYCVGAMAVVGSLEAGILQSYDTLFAKSLLDGITSILFASTLGIGVIFSAIPVFLYQGSITLLSTYISSFLTPEIITEISAVGGILIMAIGINILGIKKIKVANLLPSIFVLIVYFLIQSSLSFL